MSEFALHQRRRICRKVLIRLPFKDRVSYVDFTQFQFQYKGEMTLKALCILTAEEYFSRKQLLLIY